MSDSEQGIPAFAGRSGEGIAENCSGLVVRHYQVEGRVQGVGFRWFVQREAAEIGLRGWVRNTDAGHVEAVAAGTAEQIEDLEASLRRGSRGSRVDRIRIHHLQENEAASLQEFVIEGAV